MPPNEPTALIGAPSSAPPLYAAKPIPGKGLGLVTTQPISAGQTLMVESAAVIGPKQTSPLVCVQCLHLMEDGEREGRCAVCGLPVCEECKVHSEEECRVFQEKGIKFDIK